ncbi:MAG: hypothetical protein WC615_01675 [Mucilaginibacter sp.]|jgi:hypothetical protein|uniref:hypothetical protein n=1 Tax=Mucilaginibacter sp. TaxID=1882438 RepID=UPI0035659B3F
MKQILLIAFISILSLPVFAQNIPTIKAKDAGTYVGKMVHLKDTIRSGIIVSDSIAVIKVGGVLDKDACSVIYLKKRHTVDGLDERFIGTIKRAEASFIGVVIPAASGFIIIIDGEDTKGHIIYTNKYRN